MRGGGGAPSRRRTPAATSRRRSRPSWRQRRQRAAVEPALAPSCSTSCGPRHAVDAVGVAGAKAAVCAYLSGAAAWTVEELLFPSGRDGRVVRSAARRHAPAGPGAPRALADLRRQRGGELDAPSRRRRRRPGVGARAAARAGRRPGDARDGDAAPAAAETPDDDDDDASRADDDEPDAAAKRAAAFACGFVAHCACRAVGPALVAAKLDGDLDATWGLVFAPAWGVLAIFVGVATTLCNCAPLLSAGMPARVRRRAVRLVSLCAAQLLVLAGCSFLFLLARARAGKGKKFQQVVQIVVIEADDGLAEARAQLARQQLQGVFELSGAPRSMIGVEDDSVLVEALAMPTRLLKHSSTLYARAAVAPLDVERRERGSSLVISNEGVVVTTRASDEPPSPAADDAVPPTTTTL
ncbi:hypothetical protein JL721_979 [Aureococcus anophagefferens]|nr:hypothetical protein JL721_979 [Aureococcus anophagefferens]